MTRASALVLVLAGAALAGCGSRAPSAHSSIVQLIRARQAKTGVTHQKFYGVRVSKLDPNYAIAKEEFTRANGRRWAAEIWILRRDGSTWRVTSEENMTPTCSAAPADVRKELFGYATCYPAVGVYTSLEWTRGQHVRLRYCQRPGGPGNFLAASEGVTCGTASAVARAITSRCYLHRSCVVASFHCRSYWNGRFGARFENVHHALCRDGTRRVLWDGG